jgi:hypothetical protein
MVFHVLRGPRPQDAGTPSNSTRHTLSSHSPGPTLLDFGDEMGTGMSNVARRRSGVTFRQPYNVLIDYLWQYKWTLHKICKEEMRTSNCLSHIEKAYPRLKGNRPHMYINTTAFYSRTDLMSTKVNIRRNSFPASYRSLEGSKSSTLSTSFSLNHKVSWKTTAIILILNVKQMFCSSCYR